MSTDKQTTDVPRWPSVRITRLWDLLQRARDWNGLCEWFFNHAYCGHYQMYWPVPKGHFVRCSSHLTFGFSLGAGTCHAERPRLPEIGPLLLDVKFVRLSPRVAEKVSQQAGSKNMFQPSPISDDRFLGGLSEPRQGGDASGPYEGLPFSVELRITSANLASTNAWEMMEIDPTQVFIGDSVFEHIHAMLGAAPSAFIDVNKTVSNQASTAPPCECSEVPTEVPNINDTPSSTASQESRGDAHGIDDPYDLKSGAPAVYALYLTAERCARSSAFSQEENPKKRLEIAIVIFSQLLEEMAKGSGEERALQKKLKSFFSSERLKHALRYIDPEYDPKIGRSKLEWVEDWPPAPGKAFLAQPDEQRQTFVTRVLALLIGGVQHRVDLKARPHTTGPSNQQLLLQWLDTHGLGFGKILRTSFEVIVWNGSGVPHFPKFAAPSTSHAPTSGARRASRRRV